MLQVALETIALRKSQRLISLDSTSCKPFTLSLKNDPSTLSSSIKNQSSTLTGWTTNVNSGDIIRFNVDSVSTITKATLVIQGTQSS